VLQGSSHQQDIFFGETFQYAIEVARYEGYQSVAYGCPVFRKENPVYAFIRFIRPPLDIVVFFEEIEYPCDAVAVLEKLFPQLALVYALALPKPHKHAALFRRQIVPRGLKRLSEKINALDVDAIYPEVGRLIEGEKLHLDLPSW
jgi:hypothetical protein